MAHPQGMNHYPGITPPSMILAGTIINLLMFPEQGIRNVWIASQSQGHLAQDVAYAMAGPRLCAKYLENFGYKDVTIYSGCGEIPGRYPTDLSQEGAIEVNSGDERTLFGHFSGLSISDKKDSFKPLISSIDALKRALIYVLSCFRCFLLRVESKF